MVILSIYNRGIAHSPGSGTEHDEESGHDDATYENEGGPHEQIHAPFVFLGPLPILFAQPCTHLFFPILLLHYEHLFLSRGVPVKFLLLLKLMMPAHDLIVTLLLQVLHGHQPGLVRLEVVAFRTAARRVLRLRAIVV